ncbi:MAG: hypothetical protein PHR35_22395, partial [Kiritimatiellae bacterium]|nr:hypothetical protein [Kiritimatiellia bacterium]
WTQKDPRPLKQGETVELSLALNLRPHSQPWRVKPETVTRVVPQRTFDFLSPAPHPSGIDVEPVDVCAPVFGIDQPVRLRARMKLTDVPVPPNTHYIVTDAFTGQEVGNWETQTVRQAGAIWSLCEWRAPKPGVYDIGIRGHDGKAPFERQYQVAVVGPIDQPSMQRGDKLPLRLVDTIRCGSTNDPHPFWSSAADSRIVESPLGDYRETGAKSGSWMQYKIDVKPHRTYIVETDYPDDADRATSVSIAEPNDPESAKPWGWLRSPSGCASGTAFPIMNKKETFRFVYFSGDTTWATVNIMNPMPVWKAGAVTEIRLYELEGDLPKLDLPADNGRTLALYTESGNVAFSTLYTGRQFRKNEESWGVFPDTIFYREWYGVAVNLVKYLRFTGQDGYVCGLYRYDSPYYPSRQYSHPVAPSVVADFTALLAKMFEHNDLKLYPSVMTTRTWPGTTRHGNRTQYEVVTEGEHTAVAVSPDGQQDLRTFLAGIPALNPASPELRDELANMAEEIATRYAPFKSVKGIFWIAGGAWQPFYTVQGGNATEESATRYSYDDDTMARFFKKLGKPLPGDPKDPKRFRTRYDWIKANAWSQWIAFRCELLDECHAVIAGRIRKVNRDLVYYPCEINNVIQMRYRFGGAPYDLLKLHAMDPAPHAGKEGTVYVHHRWDLALLKDNMSQPGITPEQMKQKGFPLQRDTLLDPELNAAYEKAAPYVGVFLQRQFQEYGYEQPTNVPPGFYRPSPASEGLRWPIHANIEYAQPAGWRWLADYALMFARTTPEFVTWMWSDGRIPMGHEEQIQYLAAFIRSLPAGRFEALGETPSGVFARAQPASRSKPRALYLVNTSMEPQTVLLRANDKATLADRVTGERMAGTGGAWTIPLDRAALRSFTLEPGGGDIRLESGNR